ncbi:hypothetical protein I3842_05G218900 [Carya illinoinensis]|uniref:Retrotransposon Copia-like N-terminal domain-containing protein n=1 Tax=Carya illinoinensis TaxID=32201 RepID=A0A922JNU6_CARIL|nr:hypothetical protein I3842_05G218900 [Carya illinoinensis]
MFMALSAKNKTGFIDGAISKPFSNNDPLYAPWIHCNHMVHSWILNSLSRDLAASVIYIDNAHDIWLDLKERFSQSNNQTSLSTYFTKLKGYWDELLNYRPLPECSCGALQKLAEYQHKDYVMHFLMGLNDSFSHISSQILLMDPLPPIIKFFSWI